MAGDGSKAELVANTMKGGAKGGILMFGPTRLWIPLASLFVIPTVLIIATDRLSGWERWAVLVFGAVLFILAVYSVGSFLYRILSLDSGCVGVGRERPILDQRVRFTLYRPDRVRPEVWNTMLAFAYRGGDGEEGARDIKESFKEVEGQAAALLGPQIQGFASLTTDSRYDIPRGESLRFVPRVNGLDFNPPERSFRWVERIHQEVFRFRAPNELDGEVVHGRMEVYFGIILIAEIGLAIAVDSSVAAIEADPKAAVHGRPYRKIFASYSHKDLPVVTQFEVFADAFGDVFMRDWTHLRAGQVWSERLQSMITEADVFQLFWSTNSMVSDFVRQEWEYALSLNRPSFIRPVYWEEPMPERPDIGLPPESLRRLQFYKFARPTPAADRLSWRGKTERREHKQQHHWAAPSPWLKVYAVLALLALFCLVYYLLVFVRPRH